MLVRCIAAQWALEEDPSKKKVYEGDFDETRIKELNSLGYNIYWLPNHPSLYNPNKIVDGTDIDKFEYVFVDMDLKQGEFKDENAFIDLLKKFSLEPSQVNFSGNGVHVYWKIKDLDSMSFLRLQRRLCRFFDTDEAVSKIYQLMRLPNTDNVKQKENIKRCREYFKSEIEYTGEQLDKALPLITKEDEEYCKNHYHKTYNLADASMQISDIIPMKFKRLLASSEEVANIWAGNVEDRSKGDYRLGQLMFYADFTKEEALSVLVNAPKALERSPKHRIGYATGIVNDYWKEKEPSSFKPLSFSVEEITKRKAKPFQRFYCNKIVDGTNAGFRLGQVLGLVGGSGVGKTTFALNLFRWFVELNPEYTHFFVSLEQPEEEIANRWIRMCGDNERLKDKVQILGNYDDNGIYRNLSLTEIKDYILSYIENTGQKVGCIVLDHIGVLRKSTKNGENEGLMQVCQSLKSFAVETNTFFVVQSQTNRDKAGIGDIELSKDAAYGSTSFEWFVDFLVTIWAPLKRIYPIAPNMTVTAFKFCKIRDKNVKLDKIQEDQRHLLMFDVDNEHYRLLTQDEKKSFTFYNTQATNLRKQDRKTDILDYKSEGWI